YILSLYPLVVDLDGTLIRTDMLHESMLRILHDNPLKALCVPYWLWEGKAVLKQNLAGLAKINPTLTPYNHEFIDWLKHQREEGRTLILCTASDVSIANAISNHLGIFDEVMASDGTINLAGKHKAEALVERFGHAGFDYAGNSRADLAVWQCSRHAIVVNASEKLAHKAEQLCEVEKVFEKPKLTIVVWSKLLRVHQWLKNSLLFIPLLAAHQLTNIDANIALFLAFIAFSLCASSVYIVNDLLDLYSDRQHHRKSRRPFASGVVPIWKGVVLAPLLLIASLLLAWLVNMHFLAWMLFYFVLTCLYSWQLKRMVLIDCLTLTTLYTLRIVAGAAAVNMSLSFWLLAFSVFLFLSLAFVKRYAELEKILLHGKRRAHGRGYYTDDAPLIQTFGITSGYAAVLVLALYLNSDAVIKLYKTPQIIWGAVPVMLFWLSSMWVQAHRGKMHDDPIIFAIKDKASLLAGVIFASILVIGTQEWSW
ncbi:partial Decaprenyl-phosphate phosphoribosyltransferase, partial [Patescibacteria group bacterium]